MTKKTWAIYTIIMALYVIFVPYIDFIIDVAFGLTIFLFLDGLPHNEEDEWPQF